MKLLISVRNETEALLAAAHGADFIDLKEPRDGALGGLPVETILSVVRALRDKGVQSPISATIGDMGMPEIERIVAAVEAVGACGVDYVKVGIEVEVGAAALLERLAVCGSAVVPVFIADRGLDLALVAHACRLGFPALMADTSDKRVGSLFDCASAVALQAFVSTVRRSGRLVGLAGALRLPHLGMLRELAPDFAGFRSAVCAGDRAGRLEAGLLGELATRLAA